MSFFFFRIWMKASLPRIDRSPRESPTCGSGLREGRSVVFGNSVFLAPSLKGKDTPRTGTSSHQRQDGLAVQVEHDVGVQWCSCFGVVPDGGSCCCWTTAQHLPPLRLSVRPDTLVFCSTMGRILIVITFFAKKKNGTKKKTFGTKQKLTKRDKKNMGPTVRSGGGERTG